MDVTGAYTTANMGMHACTHQEAGQQRQRQNGARTGPPGAPQDSAPAKNTQMVPYRDGRLSNEGDV